MVLRGKRNSLS